MIESAFARMANLNTSRGWTTLALRLPMETTFMPMIERLALTAITTKCSRSSSPKYWRRTGTTSSGPSMTLLSPGYRLADSRVMSNLYVCNHSPPVLWCFGHGYPFKFRCFLAGQHHLIAAFTQLLLVLDGVLGQS